MSTNPLSDPTEFTLIGVKSKGAGGGGSFSSSVNSNSSVPHLSSQAIK